jgi:hypothetical protein
MSRWAGSPVLTATNKIKIYNYRISDTNASTAIALNPTINPEILDTINTEILEPTINTGRILGSKIYTGWVSHHTIHTGQVLGPAIHRILNTTSIRLAGISLSTSVGGRILDSARKAGRIPNITGQISGRISSITRKTPNITGQRAMSSDADYAAFLAKSNNDYSRPPAGSDSRPPPYEETLNTTAATDVHPAVKALGDRYYVSDADEPFVAVDFKWDGSALPTAGL